jgi:hypothetical protein
VEKFKGEMTGGDKFWGPSTVKYVEIKDQIDQRLRQLKNVLMKLNLK